MPWRERRANHVWEPSWRNHPTGTKWTCRRLLIGREEKDLPQGGVAGQEAGGAPELFDVRGMGFLVLKVRKALSK